MSLTEAYYHLRVTGVEEMHLVWDEVTKRQIVGFAMKEHEDVNGVEVKHHAHYVIYTNAVIVKRLRQAFREKGISGNKCYSLEHVKDYASICKYVCKMYTPESVEYQYGWAYTADWFQEQKELWDAGYDPKKASKGCSKTENLLETLCDGLDSGATRQMIARNVAEYCRKNFKEAKWWSNERLRSLVNQVELQLKGHNPEFIDVFAERLV